MKKTVTVTGTLILIDSVNIDGKKYPYETIIPKILFFEGSCE